MIDSNRRPESGPEADPGAWSARSRGGSRRDRNEPEAVGSVLRGLMRELGPRRKRARLQEALDRVLGEQVAAHCCVLGLRQGRLLVEVDSAPLFAELRSFRSEEIRAGVNEWLQTPEVAEVTFRMGGTGHV